MTPPTKLEDLLSPAQISGRDGKPILSPNKSEEISAIARYANDHRLAIEILGAGTKRSWGNGFFPDLLLDTTHLTGVLSHSWQDLTATVAAGTRWADMQRALAQHNQFVALDPLWPEIATVGGVIATNDSGPIRLKYGSLRDLIIGMTIVLADGTIARSGGKVVKNVAGYDLHKLMIGAHGTLGIITEVTFRLHPLPAQTQVFTVVSTASEPAELMLKLLDSQLSIQAMQLRANSSGYALDIEFATIVEALIPQIPELERITQSLTGKGGRSPVPELDLLHPFSASAELFAEPGGMVIKVTMLPSCVEQCSIEVVRLGGSAVTQATGIMLARFDEDIAPTDLEALRMQIETAGQGSMTLLRAPASLHSASLTEPSAALPLMREIKRQFDPNRTLNPGRFLGGI